MDYFNEANKLYNLKEYDKALELIDYITLLKEDNAEVYAIKSSIYEELGKKEESRQALEIAKKYNNIFEYKV